MAAKRKYLDVDELYRSKFEDYPVEPGDAIRTELMRRVSRKEFLRFNPARFNIYYLAAAAATVSVALILAFSGVSSDKGVNNQPVISDTTATESITSKPDVNEAVAESATESGNTSGTRNVPAKTSEDKPAFRSADRRGVSVTPIVQVLPDTNAIDKNDVATFTEDAALKQDREKLKSSFALTSTSGCAPLKVGLLNTSVNYETITWSSGDGRVSSLDNFEWNYSKPGTYTIVLKAVAGDGREEISSQVITVHASPVARFDVTPANSEINDREILIYNYSEGSLTSKWEFGDGETSLMREPLHGYKRSGKYRILLTVTNEFGCSDTVSAIYSTSVGTNTIEFPNAFIPNQNGPTGGQYSPRSDEAATVFHPEYEGVTEYYLVVYSRTGAVLFESHNLNIGWDGYYKGQLCDPGVYVWRAKGRFINGEQFMKSGDVTLLRF
ncbi:MAG: gliding motility-associated C-terminal domain-containing protein [Bacteroidales bacterium]|nr:gliding motility-associated C-terminal domain-containing protein [Bacteroidales bacterium]